MVFGVCWRRGAGVRGRGEGDGPGGRTCLPPRPVSPRARPPAPRRPLFPKNRHVWGGRGEGGEGPGARRKGQHTPGTLPPPSPAPPLSHTDDPSAGSPTETLLRLLLPLDAGDRGTSVSGTRPNSSPQRPIGRSDGRCVQRAGTHSARDDDARLRGIPGSRRKVASVDPNHAARSGVPCPLGFG